MTQVELPEPRMDMDDVQAADWLDDLASLFPTVEAMHIRAFAKRLRERHAKDQADAQKKRIEESARSAESAAEEAQLAADDARSAAREAREAVSKLRSK